ncbi:hypothetical protein T484DRAFT_1985343 [Baffinella frigidus]|nr:hypothetical protein T484DRAFT_1985343 [Cryptophyta sp. CCMP2293]
MAGIAASDRARGMTGSRSPEPAIPEGIFKSGSFDPAMLPKVSLSFLNYEDHTKEQLNSTPTNHQHKTPPMSPLQHAAIEKCIAAIQECKASLALRRRARQDNLGQATKHYSEKAVWAWLEGATDEPPAYRTLPPPSAPPHDAFGRLGAPPTRGSRAGGRRVRAR